MERFIAHITPYGKIQTVQEHCLHTAEYARAALNEIGLGNTAYLAGLLHDAGKFTNAFNEYITAAAEGKPVVRGSVNHTFAGVGYLLQNFHSPTAPETWGDYTSELIAYACGAHHGLFDCVDAFHRSGFQHRMDEPSGNEAEAMGNFNRFFCTPEQLKEFHRAASEEIEKMMDEKFRALLDEKSDAYDEELLFYSGAAARLLLSAVIEGDRRDTAEFMHGSSSTQSIEPDWASILQQVENKIADFPRHTSVQRARAELSARCRAYADKPGGLIRLNLPTGAGKTLASLRYALAHAAVQGKRRIIYTAPLLSILEQNAQVIRDYIQDDSLILEHQSNVIQESSNEGELSDLELLKENWSAPVIITTMVQLLNTMFAGKTSCIRRFHALCNSVIIIDEVQTLPTRMISQFNGMLNFLTTVCNATVLLCSATQPALETVEHPLAGEIPDMVPYDPELWRAFRRTEILDGGSSRLNDLPKRVLKELEQSNSVLFVCNKKDEARFIFAELQRIIPNVFHLSADMCPKHRRNALLNLRNALSSGEQVVCVATQVIEAGVDISFERVLRLTAGMDSVIQSAGRCNRNGETINAAPVQIIRCSDENLGALREIQQGKAATEALLAEYAKNPALFQNDLGSDEAIRFYYHQLYRGMSSGALDYTFPDGASLYDLLSLNKMYADGNCPDAEEFFLRQAFREAGDRFEVFDSATTGVLVPYDEGAALIDRLQGLNPEKNFGEIQRLLKVAKQYTVSVYSYQLEKLQKANAIFPILDDGVLALRPGFYDRNTGVCLTTGERKLTEV